VDGQRDKIPEDQRHRGSRERQHGQFRVRVWYDSALQYDSEEESDYGYQELLHNGRVKIQYLRSERPRARDGLRYEDGHVLEPRRSPSCNHGKAAIAFPEEGYE